MKLFDLAAVMFAFGLATVVVSQKATVSLAEFFAMRVKIQNFMMFAVMLLIWHQILFCSACMRRVVWPGAGMKPSTFSRPPLWARS